MLKINKDFKRISEDGSEPLYSEYIDKNTYNEILNSFSDILKSYINEKIKEDLNLINHVED